MQPGGFYGRLQEYQRGTKRRTEVCRHPPSQPPRATRKVSPDGTLKPSKDIQRGFDDEISSEGASKLLVKKVELSDDEKDALSAKLLQIKKGMKVVVRYFVRTTENTGKYISMTCTVVMIDPVYRELKVMQNSDRKAVGIEKELPVIIPFDDIADLAGEGITSIEDYLGIEKYPDDI